MISRTLAVLRTVMAILSVAVVGVLTGHCPVWAAVQLPRYDHIVIVVEENHAASQIIGNKSAPFINALAAGGALMTQSYAVAHPSQPNYLALFAGDTFGVDSDACPLTLGPASNLASELLAAGYSFGGFAEDLPTAGSTVCSAGKYARKHAPWVNFANVPAGASMPFTAFSAGPQLPTVSFVVPNLDNDMHDGSVAQADAWLAANIAGYANWAKANRGLLIVTFDEDDTSEGNQISTVLYGSDVRPGTYGEPINHFSVLSTVEQIYGLPKTGLVAATPPIASILDDHPVNCHGPLSCPGIALPFPPTPATLDRPNAPTSPARPHRPHEPSQHVPVRPPPGRSVNVRPTTEGVAMSDEQGGIHQKASDIANQSVAKSGEIVEGAEQILAGDLKGGLAKILKAAGDIAAHATAKGFEIAADVVDKAKKPTETEPTETE